MIIVTEAWFIFYLHSILLHFGASKFGYFFDSLHSVHAFITSCDIFMFVPCKTSKNANSNEKKKLHLM